MPMLYRIFEENPDLDIKTYIQACSGTFQRLIMNRIQQLKQQACK